MDQHTKRALYVFWISMIIVVGFTAVAAHIYHQQMLAESAALEEGASDEMAEGDSEESDTLEGNLATAYAQADYVARVRITDISPLNDADTTEGQTRIAYGIETEVLEIFKGDIGETLNFEMNEEKGFEDKDTEGEAIVFIKAYEGGFAALENTTEMSTDEKLAILRGIQRNIESER